MEWTYDLTPARAGALTQQLEWMLQRQNQRFAQAVRDRHLPLRQRQVLGVIVSLVGLVATAGLVLLSPQITSMHVLLAAFFTGTLVVATILPRVQTWSRRVAGRSIRRRAERTVARLPRAAHYRVDDLPRAGLVLSTTDAIAAFARPGSFHPIRVIPVPGDAERDAVIAAFVAAGASHQHVTGAVDGYVDPLPVAQVR